MVLKSTLANSGQIKEVAGDIEVAKSQLELARAALYPRASAMLIAAPMFTVTGDAQNSTTDLSKWGPFIRGSIEVVQPLFTFGQISSYRKAAEHQILARTEQTEMRRAEVVYNAKEIYYGYLMASELDILVGDLSKFLEDAIESAEKKVKGKKTSKVKPHDIYKLKTTLDDLKQKGLYAKQARTTAEKAISWISGSKFVPPDDISLTPEEFTKKTLEQYLRHARANRPEIRALAEGQEARAALRDAKRAQDYPVIFLGAFASQGWSPVVQKQNSMFAFDPFNSLQGGLGVGLKLDLEFKKHSAEAAEQEAELIKLKATQSYAEPGIDLQVKKAYAELEQALQSLEVAERRKKTARKWFVSSAMGWSIGITPAKDLMEALEGDGLAKKNYIETIYFHNISLAHLSQAVGEEVTTLKYR